MKPLHIHSTVRTAFFATFLTAGCAGGQSGTMTELRVEDCSERSTQISIDDDRAGASAVQLVRRVSQECHGAVVWREGAADDWSEHTTTLQGSVELDADSASFVEQQKKTDESICDRTFLKFGVLLHFVTEDGAFNEVLSGQLTHDFATGITSWTGDPLALDELKGEFDPTPFATEYEVPVLWFSLQFGPQINGYVSVGEGAESDIKVGASIIATVGEPPPQQ